MKWYDICKIGPAFVKTASGSQDMWDITVGDIQRWVIDALHVQIFLNKTPFKITIAANVFNSHLGEMMWQDFWKFDIGEMNAAKALFKKICSKAEEIVEEFRETESPNNLVHAYLRNELRKINSDNLPKTNIPNITNSLKIEYEKDWRNTIYGNRYPTRDTSGF